MQDDYLGVAEVRNREYKEIWDEVSKKYPELERDLDVELWTAFGCSGHKMGCFCCK